MTPLRILFLQSVVSQVRYRKRIAALRRLGASTLVMSFERDYYSGQPEGGYVSLGRLEHGAYPRRLYRLAQSLRRVRAEAMSTDIIYAFGLDMLLLAALATRGLRRRVRLVYEVGDIRPIQLGKGAVPSTFRRWERFLVERCHLVVVTSRLFWEEYYLRILDVRAADVHVIENKLEPGFAPRASRPVIESNNCLRIGYFGLLRCPRSWEILRRLAKQAGGRVQVYVRGLPGNPRVFVEEARRTPHLEYGGPYLAPDDLPELYGHVHLVWACYPYHDGSPSGNWRWARTNRFYEACYFTRPMVCQSGSADGEIVTNLGLGLSLPLDDVSCAADRLLNITAEDIHTWNKNLETLPPGMYLYGDEHDRLLAALTG